MYGAIRIRPKYVECFIIPPHNSRRYILLEATLAGLSRYLIVTADEDVLDEVSELHEKLPKTVRPAMGSKMVMKRTPQKLLMLVSEGRYIIPERILPKEMPNDTPAYEYIAHKLLSPVTDVDDVIRMMAAIEDRKAVDYEGYKRIEKNLRNVFRTYLAGVLHTIGPRKIEEKRKILSSHIRIKAVEDAAAQDALFEIYKNPKAVDNILRKASAHIRKRRKELLNYTKGERPAAFLVFTRDSLNVAYVYEMMNDLGKEGYDVREVIVGYDSSSEDLAIRVSKTLQYLGDVKTKTLLMPETPGEIVKEYLESLINKYEERGMKLFIDGRGGSPATFLAVLRHFRDRLVLPDR